MAIEYFLNKSTFIWEHKLSKWKYNTRKYEYKGSHFFPIGNILKMRTLCNDDKRDLIIQNGYILVDDVCDNKTYFKNINLTKIQVSFHIYSVEINNCMRAQCDIFVGLKNKYNLNEYSEAYDKANNWKQSKFIEKLYSLILTESQIDELHKYIDDIIFLYKSLTLGCDKIKLEEMKQHKDFYIGGSTNV